MQMDHKFYEELLVTVAQAAIEADRSLKRLELLDRYIFTIKGENKGVDLQIDRNGKITLFKG
jgi:hypothetical protein